MNIFKRTPQKLPQNSPRLMIEPEEVPEPDSVEGYLRRGYAFYARSKLDQAIADFQKALARDASAIDAIYALGMAQKAQKKGNEAVDAFLRVIELIRQGKIEDAARASMLERMARGHINMIQTGDWNLEKEIWRHES